MSAPRPKKTDIVRKRTGCQRCRSKRRKCDEAQPECMACIQRGLSCPGYQRQLTFKDVSARTAETSKKVERARWAILRRQDARRDDGDAEAPGDHPRLRGRAVELTDSDSPEGAYGTLQDSPDDTSSHANDVGVSALPRPVFEHSLDFLRAPAIENPRLSENSSCELPNWGSLHPSSTTFMAGDQSCFMETNDACLDTLVSWTDTEVPVYLWDHFVNFPEASRSQTPSSVLPTNGQIPRDTNSDLDPPTEEELLQNFEENISKMIPLALPFHELFRVSSGLRAAALALSASHMCWSSHAANFRASPSSRTKLKSQSDCHYYDFAVRDINKQLKQPYKRSGEQLFGATMLLLYRDLLVGSQTDVREHLNKLEIIASRLDVSSICTPTLLRAWRMLMYDIRTRTMPTRKSLVATSPSQPCISWDAQLAIHEIFSSIWTLQVRFVMEASFDTADGSSTASKGAVQWLCSVLGRQCDLHQLQQKDYHEDDLSADTVESQCAAFESCLDSWHQALQPQDLPIPKLGATKDIITGPTFGAIVPYRLTDERKALDYASYLVSRMMCSYLRSRVGPQGSAAASMAWAWIVLGIAATLGLRKHQLFGPSIFMLLQTTALVSEGTVIATAILDGLLPRARSQEPSPLEAAELLSLQRTLDLFVQEKHRGRAIRAIVSRFDEHQKLDQLYEAHTIVAFGDYNGREPFRDVYQLPRH